MTLFDARGVPVSTNNVVALQRYEEAVELSAGFFLDPMAVLDAALQADPSFAMAHCLRAGLAVTATDRTLEPLLADSIAAVEALGRVATDRERAHAAAGRRWLQGDFAGAVRSYGDILLNYPRDLVALQIAHLGDFYLGASTMLRDRVAQVLPHWDSSTPGYGYVLGMYSFGLEETGAYVRAEDTGRRALEINPRDPWAVHAVAHVMEMQGRIRDGIEWLTSRESDWADNNGFAFHNWWHLALYHLDAGDTQSALRVYDERIRPQPSQAPLEMIDAAALLWRLELRQTDVGGRWDEIATAWEPFAEHGYYAFNDAHAVMSFVGARRFDLAERTIATLERHAAGTGTNAMMSRDVGLPLSRALLAFGREKYGDAVEELLPIRTIANRFGGSNAQRDFIHLTLLEAALRAGNGKLARALAAERTEQRPVNPFNWQLTARALDAIGQSKEASKAREHAEMRRKAQLGAARAVA